jgi:hypothetical protein
MRDLPQCSICKPPSAWYCDNVCEIAREYREEEENEGY